MLPSFKKNVTKRMQLEHESLVSKFRGNYVRLKKFLVIFYDNRQVLSNLKKGFLRYIQDS